MDGSCTLARDSKERRAKSNSASGAARRRAPPQPAVSIEAGAIWGRVYDEVTVKGGRYVLGADALTVEVAGVIYGGGFSGLSKASARPPPASSRPRS